jgi:hypothetical protein
MGDLHGSAVEGVEKVGNNVIDLPFAGTRIFFVSVCESFTETKSKVLNFVSRTMLLNFLP